MSENVSTLEATCDQYVGRTLIVEPHYGHGWYHPSGGPFGDHGVPTPFHLRVERVYSYKDERRGVLARVTEPGFVYDGFWLVSMTRHIGVWNFTDRPATYNLLLCPEEPVEGKEEDSPEYGKLWPVWHCEANRRLQGSDGSPSRCSVAPDFDARRDAEAKQQGNESVFRYAGTVRLSRNTEPPST